MNIYVGNLSPEVTEVDLREAFQAFGQVNSVTILRDKFTGEPRGFGFIEMTAKNEALAAIRGLNGTDLRGQRIRVYEAHSHPGGGGRGRERGDGDLRFW